MRVQKSPTLPSSLWRKRDQITKDIHQAESSQEWGRERRTALVTSLYPRSLSQARLVKGCSDLKVALLCYILEEGFILSHAEQEAEGRPKGRLRSCYLAESQKVEPTEEQREASPSISQH